MSVILNDPLSLVISACRRDTVMSSRNMSLSGCLPTVVTGLASTNRVPALGPLLTTSMAAPALSSSSGTAISSSVSTSASTGLKVIVVSPWGVTARYEPHLQQYTLSSGLFLPQAGQNIS